jgi:outer membrane murein-binding lipoprotein Lpp
MSYKSFVLAGLGVLILSVCVGRVSADNSDKPSTEADALARQLTDLKKVLTELQTTESANWDKIRRLRRSVGDLRIQLDELQQDVSALRRPQPATTVVGSSPVANIQVPPVNGDARKLRDDVEDLKKQLEELKTLVRGLRQDVDALPRQVPATRQSFSVPDSSSAKEVEEVKRQFDQLRAEIARSRPEGVVRYSNYGQADTGRVHLENTFAGDVTIRVNGRAYRLFPGQATIVEVPAGTFTYEVLGVPGEWGVRTRSLRPDGDYTVFAYQR